MTEFDRDGDRGTKTNIEAFTQTKKYKRKVIKKERRETVKEKRKKRRIGNKAKEWKTEKRKEIIIIVTEEKNNRIQGKEKGRGKGEEAWNPSR